jgi:hypothetical protein
MRHPERRDALRVVPADSEGQPLEASLAMCEESALPSVRVAASSMTGTATSSSEGPTLASAATRQPLGSQVQLNCDVGQSSGSDAHTPAPPGAMHHPHPETGVHVSQLRYGLQLVDPPAYPPTDPLRPTSQAASITVSADAINPPTSLRFITAKM